MHAFGYNTRNIFLFLYFQVMKLQQWKKPAKKATSLLLQLDVQILYRGGIYRFIYAWCGSMWYKTEMQKIMEIELLTHFH